MNERSRISYVPLILLIVFFAGYYLFFGRTNRIDGYDARQLAADLKEDKITSVTIRPDRSVPTGQIIAVRKSGETGSFHVLDVTEIEQLLTDKYEKVPLTVTAVRGDSTLLNTILPMVVMGVFFFLILTMMNRQGGDSANAKMMNFGRSRARKMSEKLRKNH